MNNFLGELIRVIDKNIYNYYLDNYDNYRFNKKINGVKDYLIHFLSNLGIQTRSVSLDVLASISADIPSFDRLYNLLEDEKSRDTLLQVLAYRILGHRKIKLPLNTPDFKKNIDLIDRLKNANDYFDSGFLHFILYRYNLNSLGYPLEFYFTSLGIWHTFIIKQYEYRNESMAIKADKGNIVFDCGGCWGDTALYFANEVGANGKVYSFEFVKSNIEIFNRNISMNQNFSGNIHLVNHPVWSESGIAFYVNDRGPASTVSFQATEHSMPVYSLSIDEFVAANNISGVDFIKMDIEGAELNALKGAMNVIKKFKPKLAIAVYHRIPDFYEIPFWINDLNLGYKFYLGHYSIHKEETILFAQV